MLPADRRRRGGQTGHGGGVGAVSRRPRPHRGERIVMMAGWANFVAGDGTGPDGTPVLSAEQMRAWTTGVTPKRVNGFYRRLADTNFSLYALGWTVSDFAGEYAVHHGGSGPGAITEIMVLPERGLAVAVLANDMVPSFVLAGQILDNLAGDGEDWIALGAERVAAMAGAGDDAAEPLTAPEDAAAPTLPLSAYAGVYRNAWYGDITVSEESGGLVIHLTRSQKLRGPLRAFDGDTFLAVRPDRLLNADALVSFEITEGAVTGMRLRAAGEDTDFSYDFHHLAPQRVN
ncbi:MAG: DUF3471 domain-containing protein [Oceanicaulis sp.]